MTKQSLDLINQLFRPIDPDGLPCPRCGDKNLRWLSQQLGAACERCLEQHLTDVLEDPDLELPLDPAEFLTAVRAHAIDSYCLFSLADRQKGA